MVMNMSNNISKHVIDSINKLSNKDYELSLTAICLAIDATSRNEYKMISKVGDRYKKFIQDNISIITKASMGFNLQGNMYFSDVFSKESSMNSSDDAPSISFAEIIYKARCSLVHEAELPQQLKFIDDNRIIVDEKSITLPISIVYGLLFSVIGARSNIINNTKSNLLINFKKRSLPLDSFWGQKKKIEQYLFEE